MATALFVVWLVVLVILGFALEGRTGRRVADRIAESLQATASLDDANLGLVTGGLDLGTLTVHRDDLVGKLALDVGSVHCDLPPLGLALVDRNCGDLEIAHVRLDVSSASLFRIRRPKRE